MRKIDMLNQLQSEMQEARTTAEQLCNDWGWTLTNEVQDRIVINKGKIVAVTDPRDQEEIDNLYREIGRHIGRINQLAAENEQLTEENKQLREELAALKQAKEEQNNIVKEADAVKPQTNKPMNKLDLLRKAKQREKENAEKDIIKEALETKEVVEETKDEVEMTYDRHDTPEAIEKGIPEYADIIIGVNGNITINNETYKFKARRAYMPIIYGCFDEKLVEQAREEMKKINRFNITDERTNDDPNFKYAQDKEYPIVVWRLTDDNIVKYHAYTRTKGNRLIALTWDKTYGIIKTTVESLFTNKPAWRKINSNSKALADKFMAVCADIWPEDFTTDKDDSKDTNEIVVDFTKDENVTDTTNDKNVVDVANDATAGSDDLDI